jgi:uncharacterized membrane protein
MFFKRLAVGFIVFIAIDFLWIGVIMTGFYTSQIGPWARKSGDSLAPLWTPAFLLYLLTVIGIIVFVLPRAGADAPVWQTAAYGALFGIIGYGVYDLTNYSTLANWPLTMTIVDTLWGGVVCGLTAAALRFADRFLT